MDKRINDFFQDGKVDLVTNEQSSLFNLNGVPNYFTSTWSSDGGPLVHDTYETYRIIFNGSPKQFLGIAKKKNINVDTSKQIWEIN